ncbi:MAG: GWxTD domain-containing protein [Gemmatimonadota bacterium]|nr:GWxTD domain-containing protein [Gemmatimonadota bacterium]
MTAKRVTGLLFGATLAAADVCTAAAALPQTAPDPYERGMALVERGDVEGALTLWIGARDSLSAEGAEDARIGTAFIRAVTESEFERFEEIATVMFYWGFSGVATERTRDEILAEGRRTFTLADSTAVEYWDAVGRQDAGGLALAVKRFWIERDPTPATLLNERLIEHWRRIADARRDFVYNRSSAYGTDDRGTFFVKYGLPDRVTRGHLRVSESERRSMNLPVDYIARFDQQPQYEIWRYATMHPGEFTYFLFGNTDGTGPFRHVQGLHEILSPSARTSGEARYGGIRAQYYLEFFYYEDLARMGGPYGLRFGELERLWFSSRRVTEGTLEAISRRHIADDQWAGREPLPPAISEYDDRLRSALSAQAARVLEGGEPRLLVMAVSSPIWLPGTAEGAIRDSVTLAPYTASHTVIARDGRLSEIARAGMLPVDGPGHLSTLVLRHQNEIRHLSVSARHDIQEEEALDAGSRLPGQLHFIVNQPLGATAKDTAGGRGGPERAEPAVLAATTDFEVSDLIVGIAPRPELDLGDLPVPLLPATRFWRDDPLRVYFEVYRPERVAAGSLELRVYLNPVARTNPAVPLPDVDESDLETAAVFVTLESPEAHEGHFFDLDLRNERPGLLRVVLEITDDETGATRLRVTPIRLLEN